MQCWYSCKSWEKDDLNDHDSQATQQKRNRKVLFLSNSEIFPKKPKMMILLINLEVENVQRDKMGLFEHKLKDIDIFKNWG